MSTTQPSESPRAAPSPSPRARAERLFETLFSDPALCPLCFARKRCFYPEFDRSVAEHLVGENNTVFESFGHRLDDEGGLMVHSATSDADPNAYLEVVPPKKGKYGEILEPARPRTVCECGTVDYDFDDPRSMREMYTAVENLAEHVREREDGFHLEAAKEVVRQSKTADSLAGRDRRVLIGAIEFGLRKAES